MHLSLFTTFCPPNILVCPPNIFDKSTPVSMLWCQSGALLSSSLVDWKRRFINSLNENQHVLDVAPTNYRRRRCSDHRKSAMEAPTNSHRPARTGQRSALGLHSSLVTPSQSLL